MLPQRPLLDLFLAPQRYAHVQPQVKESRRLTPARRRSNRRYTPLKEQPAHQLLPALKRQQICYLIRFQFVGIVVVVGHLDTMFSLLRRFALQSFGFNKENRTGRERLTFTEWRAT